MARRSVVLPDIHADPADRLIVATAQALDCTLISKDRRLRRYPDVEVIWYQPLAHGAPSVGFVLPYGAASHQRRMQSAAWRATASRRSALQPLSMTVIRPW